MKNGEYWNPVSGFFGAADQACFVGYHLLYSFILFKLNVVLHHHPDFAGWEIKPHYSGFEKDQALEFSMQ
jgi:hypothetical protein